MRPKRKQTYTVRPKRKQTYTVRPKRKQTYTVRRTDVVVASPFSTASCIHDVAVRRTVKKMFAMEKGAENKKQTYTVGRTEVVVQVLLYVHRNRP